MKNILVPCDFSTPAVEAFKFAAQIAAKNKGVITLLHVCELPVLFDSATVMSFEQSYMDDVKKETEKNFAKIKTNWGTGVKVKTRVEFGGIIGVIRKAIKDFKIDLIVMGTHGATGLKEITIGSNAEKIVRTSDVPVIAVRKAPKSISSIVFPTLAEPSEEQLTMRIKQLQDFFKAKLHVVYLNTPGHFKRDIDIKPLLEKFTKRFMLKDFTLTVFNDLDEQSGIINFTSQVKADMVAMKTRGRRGLAHFAIGSIAEDVVNHIQCPIWTWKVR